MSAESAGTDISSCATFERVKDSSLCEWLQTLAWVHARNLTQVDFEHFLLAFLKMTNYILRNILEMGSSVIHQ